MQPLGKYLVIIGVAIAALGILLWLGGNKFGWFGRLPGDISVTRGGFRFYSPLMSMLLISIAVSVIFWIINRLMR